MSPYRIRAPRWAGGDNLPRLFRLRRHGHAITELSTRTDANERSLQRLVERHLPQLLDVEFVASEYVIGGRHGGRIDTIAIDRHGAPAVIEYKRALSVNLISQGLYYLDWLDEHRGEFQMLVHESLGAPMASTIRSGEPRLICVAAAFHRYDLRAVRQINRHIELVRYQWFGDDLLFLEKLEPGSS